MSQREDSIERILTAFNKYFAYGIKNDFQPDSQYIC